jgi:hypothetical protein
MDLELLIQRLTAEVDAELRLVDAQLERAGIAEPHLAELSADDEELIVLLTTLLADARRAGAPAVKEPAPVPMAPREPASSDFGTGANAVAGVITAPPVVEASPALVAAMPEPAAASAPSSPLASSTSGLRVDPGPKAGMLLNYGKPSFMRSFKSQFVCVDTTSARWYKSEADYLKGAEPSDFVPLTATQSNSRGSVFNVPAVCWPVISKAECPKATDANKFYFAIQYPDAKQGSDQPFLVLAAATAAERDEWVGHITQIIPIYVAASTDDAERWLSIACRTPYHTKYVVSGEAPRH